MAKLSHDQTDMKFSDALTRLSWIRKDLKNINISDMAEFIYTTEERLKETMIAIIELRRHYEKK